MDYFGISHQSHTLCNYCVQLLPVDIIVLRWIQVVAHISSLFLFVTWYSVEWIYHGSFFHFSCPGHLLVFQLLAGNKRLFMNKAVINILVKKFLYYMSYFSQMNTSQWDSDIQIATPAFVFLLFLSFFFFTFNLFLSLYLKCVFL